MDMRQAWCLGFSVAITLAAIGSIATLTDGSVDIALAADDDIERRVTATGADTPTFRPIIELPDELQAGATANVTLELVGVDGETPVGTLPMVQVDLALELVPAARGWVRLPRDRHLLAPTDLEHRSFALQVAPSAPCGTVPGRLTVTVTTADGQHESSQARRLLPPIACDQLPPTAPASLHAPAGSCADFDDDRPLAAAVIEPPGCGEPVRPRAPRSRDTTPDDGDERPEETEADDEADATDDLEAPDDTTDDGPDADAEDPRDTDDPDASTDDPAPTPEQPRAPEPEDGSTDDGAPDEGGAVTDGGSAPDDGTASTSGSDTSSDTSSDTASDDTAPDHDTDRD